MCVPSVPALVGGYNGQQSKITQNGQNNGAMWHEARNKPLDLNPKQSLAEMHVIVFVSTGHS